MNYRSFGRTGIKVSPNCLGAMMFGAMGNPPPRRRMILRD
jgi:aryl-alcohol dehydrogenase-like predicted oxidoreductase